MSGEVTPNCPSTEELFQTVLRSPFETAVPPGIAGVARDKAGDLANVLIGRRRYEQRVAVDEIAGVRSVRGGGQRERAAA